MILITHSTLSILAFIFYPLFLFLFFLSVTHSHVHTPHYPLLQACFLRTKHRYNHAEFGKLCFLLSSCVHTNSYVKCAYNPQSCMHAHTQTYIHTHTHTYAQNKGCNRISCRLRYNLGYFFLQHKQKYLKMLGQTEATNQPPSVSRTQSNRSQTKQSKAVQRRQD